MVREIAVVIAIPGFLIGVIILVYMEFLNVL